MIILQTKSFVFVIECALCALNILLLGINRIYRSVVNILPDRGFSKSYNLLGDRFLLKEKTIEALSLLQDTILLHLHGSVNKSPIARALSNRTVSSG